MKVLSVTSEAVPLVKTGGLADVAGSLPRALAGAGVDMRVLLPAYPGLLAMLTSRKVVLREAELWGGEGRVVSGKDANGESWLLLDAPHLFDRPGGPYSGPAGDWPDNPERFAALSWVAAEIAERGLSDGWQPEIVHAHDWQAALAPAYLRYRSSPARSVLTIHNIAFQGVAPGDRINSLRLPHDAFHPGQYEYHGQISTLKAGMVTADAVTTVSPRYAQELLRPEFGMGLQGVVADIAAEGRLSGILNGIDIDAWDPASVKNAPAFSADDLTGKVEARALLLAEFGLSATDGPLCILVSRLSQQKGIDLLLEALPDLMRIGGSLAVLGSGDEALEAGLRGAADHHPGRVAVRIGYDEALSKRMFAGADAVLVPSRFEPCGLTQLYGLRFGTIPIVAATGGLADTVIHASPMALAAGAATGVVFHPVDASALAAALRSVAGLWEDQEVITAMRREGMATALSWETSARDYAALYRRVVAT